MQPPGGRTDALGDRGGESDDIVLGDLLDFLDAIDVEGGARANVARSVVWNDPGTGHRVGRGNFDLQPGLVLPLVAPDATHLRVRVPRYHPSDNLSGGIFRPFTEPRTVAARAPS